MFRESGMPARYGRAGMGRLALLVIDDFERVFGRSQANVLVDEAERHAVEVLLE